MLFAVYRIRKVEQDLAATTVPRQHNISIYDESVGNLRKQVSRRFDGQTIAVQTCGEVAEVGHSSLALGSSVWSVWEDMI